jgi:hypothetical protein
MPRFTMPALIAFAEELKPLMAELGWELDPFRGLVMPEHGIPNFGIRFQYPVGADGHRDQQAIIHIYRDRSVNSSDCRGHYGSRPDIDKFPGPTHRGWRKRLIDLVLSEARRLGRIPDEDLPFDLDALPVLPVPRASDDELRKFVLGVADSQIFTSAHLRPGDDVINMVFMPAALGAFSTPEEFNDLMPEPPESPGDKPDTPVVTYPEEPESTVVEPAYPVEPTPPEPKDVPRHILDAVEWGEIDESEVVAYREGEGAFRDRLADWQVKTWQPWKDTCDGLRSKHEADLAAFKDEHNQWEAECARLEAEHTEALAVRQDEIDAWTVADRTYRRERAIHERHITRARSRYFRDLGILWEWMHKAGPRSVNGYPIFFSLRIMHREDWNRALKAIIREEKRRESIEL